MKLGRLCNLFWCDYIMKDDYELYGHVIVFDTMYYINKYSLICDAFVGVTQSLEKCNVWMLLFCPMRLH